MTEMKTFDVVATLCEHPEGCVGRGQVGTVIERLDNEHVLVEFAKLDGVPYAIVPIPAEQLLKLKYTPNLPPNAGNADGATA